MSQEPHAADLVSRLDRIAAEQERIAGAVDTLVAQSKKKHREATGFYVPRLGRALIVGAVLGVFYFVTSSHSNVIGDLSSTVHTVTGLTGGLLAGMAIITAGVRMAGLPVKRRDTTLDGLKLIEFVFVWPLLIAAAVDYSTSFEDTAPVLTVVGCLCCLALFLDFGWSSAKEAHEVAPWNPAWLTHLIFLACLISAVFLWDLPFLSDLRHQLVNVDTEAQISNLAVIAGLCAAAAGYSWAVMRGRAR